MSYSSLFSNNIIISQLISKAIIIFCCFPIHECAHAWMAARLGDHTAEMAGRITFNPFKHLDLWGTVMLLAFGIGYAKPVTVSTYNFQKPRRDYAVVSFAGPLSNFLMAFVFLIIEHIAHNMTGTNYTEDRAIIFYCLRYAAYINFCLAIFNMIPVPPLDGYKVLLALVPNRVYSKVVRVERNSVYMLLGLFMLFNSFKVSPVTLAAQYLLNTADNMCGLLFYK